MRVNYEEKMLTDPRFKKLGQRLRISHFEAFGRVFPVWNQAYHRRDAVMAVDDVDALAELEGFAMAMLAADLASDAGEGRLRLRGVEEKIEWLLEQDAKRELAAAAKRAKREAAARSSPRTSSGASRGNTRGGVPRDVPQDVPDQEQEQEQEQDPPDLGSPLRPEPPSPAIVRAERGASPPKPPTLTAEGALIKFAMGEIDAIRARVAARFGWTDVLPLHPMDPGRGHLRERIAEDPANAERNVKHVLAIAETEAMAKPTVEFLTGAMFEYKSWRKKLGMRVADARKANGAPSSSGSLRVGGYDDDNRPPPMGKP